MLNAKEIYATLAVLEARYGFGYSNVEEYGIEIGKLQAKLSIMAQVASIKENQ